MDRHSSGIGRNLHKHWDVCAYGLILFALWFLPDVAHAQTFVDDPDNPHFWEGEAMWMIASVAIIFSIGFALRAHKEWAAWKGVLAFIAGMAVLVAGMIHEPEWGAMMPILTVVYGFFGSAVAMFLRK